MRPIRSATFREGPYAGNGNSLISRWTGNAGASWDIVQKLLVLDVTGRNFRPRRMDNDQQNIQPLIPGEATVDVKLGGQYRQFLLVRLRSQRVRQAYFRLCDRERRDCGGPLFPPGAPPTVGAFSAYPLAGRTFLGQAGLTF